MRSRFWATFRKAARRFPLPMRSSPPITARSIPRRRPACAAILLGALAYFVLPLDTIPDLLAVVGFTDDVTVLAGAIALVSAHIKPKHREAARQTLGGETPNSAGFAR